MVLEVYSPGGSQTAIGGDGMGSSRALMEEAVVDRVMVDRAMDRNPILSVVGVLESVSPLLRERPPL